MKNINVYFDDKDYYRLLKKKGTKSWRTLILELLETETPGGEPN